MKEVWLLRTERYLDGTFGHVLCLDRHWHSAELPWHDNKKNISCVPADTYIVHWDPTGNHKGYVVTSVWGRSAIEIHPLNFVYDRVVAEEIGEYKCEAKGCIGLGLSRGKEIPKHYKHPQECILSSRHAIEEFEKFMAYEHFILHIEEKFQNET